MDKIVIPLKVIKATSTKIAVVRVKVIPLEL